MSMFGFIGMMGNYEARKVARYEKGDVLVSTCSVTDSRHPFETGVAHPAYNDGRVIIVETYPSREAAEAGHERWVKTMTAEELPTVIRDNSTADLAELCDMVDDDSWRKFPRKDQKGGK